MKTIYLLCGLLCDDVVWETQADALRKEHKADVRIVSFQQDDSIAGMASRVLQDAPEQFFLAGHSMGGRVALDVYRQAAHRVQRLALLDTGYEAATPGEDARRAALVDRARADGINAIAETWAMPMLAPGNRDNAPLVNRILEMVGRMSPAIYAAQIRALLGRPDATPVLSAISCPTLILCGAEDAWSPPERHARMAALVKGSVLTEIPACGHMSTMEEPDAVTQALLRWAA
jgi:pimeloyl-ACP methyl ester carboxylesterase